MRSIGTGESWVERPLPLAKFKQLADVEFEVDWYCSVFSVDLPKHVKQTHGSRDFSGSYNGKTETLTYTKPYLGVILHELAHHIRHKLSNGNGRGHNYEFGKVLQELIDMNL